MSKRVPILIGAIAVVLCAAPYGLGMLAESNVREQIEVMSANPVITVEVTEFERSWFTSRATIEVRPGELYSGMMTAGNPMMAAVMEEVRAPFVLELGHGPIVMLNGFGIGSYDVKAGLEADTQWVQTALTTLGVPYLIELRGRAGFLTGFNFEGEIPAFEFSQDDGTLTFSGLDFSGNTNGRDLSYTANAGSLSMQSMFLSFALEGLEIAADLELRPGTISLGTAEFNVERVSAINPLLGAQEFFALERLTSFADIRINDDENLDYDVDFAVGALRIPENPEITDMELGMGFSNISEAAYEQYFSLLSDPAVLTNPNMLPLQMLPIFDEFIAAGPGMTIDPIRFSMNGGQFDGRFSIATHPEAMPTGQLMDLQDPNVAMSAFSAELELTSSKALLEELLTLSMKQTMGAQMGEMTEEDIDALVAQQVQLQIQGVVAQGMMSDDGENYSTTIVFADGVATVNGTPIPLAQMGLF